VKTLRLEMFSDAVFAIAATLLVIGVTANAPGGQLGPVLKHSWPQYVAYFVTFVLIGSWWVNHHQVLSMIGHSDRTFLYANIGLLACIAFLPFPTKLVAEHFRDNGVRAAAIAYGLTATAAAICSVACWFYAARRRRLIAESVDQHEVNSMTRLIIPGIPINAAATLVAVWSPYTGLVMFAAIVVFYVVGSTMYRS
jgi:uncharacterized membrane protein